MRRLIRKIILLTRLRGLYIYIIFSYILYFPQFLYIYIYIFHNKGTADQKLSKMFLDDVKFNRVALHGEIIHADLTKLKASCRNPRIYFRRLLVNVNGEHSSVIKLSRDKFVIQQIKMWKQFSVLMQYYLGKTVETAALESFLSKYDSSTAAAMNSLETNFNSMFKDSVTADDLNGVEPNELVHTKLKKHQTIGLEWMLMRESREENELPFFFKEQIDDNDEISYINTLSGEKIKELPECGSGGILADDMGLGTNIFYTYTHVYILQAIQVIVIIKLIV